MRCLSLAAVLLSLSAATARADDAIPLEVLEAIKAATVYVKVECEGLSGSGSGFVIKAEHDTVLVVTNHHVIEPKVEVEAAPRPSAPHIVPPRPFGPRTPHHTTRPPLSTYATAYTPRTLVRTFIPCAARDGTLSEAQRRISTRARYKNARVTVVFHSGTKKEEALPGKVLAADPEQDLAVLEVKADKLWPKPIDYIHQPRLAETMPVYIFGFPFGKVLATSKGSPAITVGKGSISSLRLNDDGELALVQIDGALNPGNSGGPVVDTQGRLVGVAVATIKNSSGIGLAIPCRELALMLRGRVGKVYLHSSQDGDGPMTVHVEVGLIDPFHRIKSVALHYLLAERVPEKTRPADPLGPLPGCRKLPLEIDNQLAAGKFVLKKGISEVALRYQAVYVYADDERRLTNSLLDTIRPKATDLAGKAGNKDKDKDKTQDEPVRPKNGERTTPARPAKPSPADDDADALVADLMSGEQGRIIHAQHQLLRTRPKQPNRAVAIALEHVMLEDGSDVLRSHAAWALQNWGTPESIPALEKALNDPSPGVQRNAKEAIRRIKPGGEE
jgi:hypothetical protein